jgi:hypothetical protein
LIGLDIFWICQPEMDGSGEITATVAPPPLLSMSPLEPVSSLSWPEWMPPLMRRDLSNYTVALPVVGTSPEMISSSLNTLGFKG